MILVIFFGMILNFMIQFLFDLMMIDEIKNNFNYFYNILKYLI